MIITLGDLITATLFVVAAIVVPYKVFKAWVWPHLKPRIGTLIMSRPETAAPAKPDMDAVCIPVEHTDMDGGMAWQMPRVSAYLDDNQTVVMLARLKLRDGKYRFSANKIAEAVGGDRNKVLDIIRQVRATPEYQLTPEQEQGRRELGLA